MMKILLFGSQSNLKKFNAIINGYALLFLFLLSPFLGSVFAQSVNPEIYLVKIRKNKKLWILDEAVNISSNPGYDNQPYFMPDNKSVLFTSQRDSTKQTDIYSYNIKEKKVSRITNTLVSEYSPRLHPDEKCITTLLVEKDSTQRIWSYDLNGQNPKLITENVDSIGYYFYLNSDSIIYYKLTNPHSLRVLSLSSKADQWICDHPSRTFLPLSNTEFLYSFAETNIQQVRIYDAKKKKSILMASASVSNLDFLWDEEFGLLKSEGPKILNYNFETKEWIDFFNFSGFGIQNITRFSISKNKKYIAVVDNK